MIVLEASSRDLNAPGSDRSILFPFRPSHSPIRRGPIVWPSPVARALACGLTALLLQIDGNVADAEPTSGAPSAGVARSGPFGGFVAEAAQRFGIPETWIRAVMRVESFGQPRAVSRKGAMGLMQIMPATWAALRILYKLGADPFDPHDNILAGAGYLRQLHDRYGAPGFLAAYNAGPGRYEDHLATGRPFPPETRSYVAVLGPLIGAGSIQTTTGAPPLVLSWTKAPLFPAQVDSKPTSSKTSSDRPNHAVSDGGALGNPPAIVSPSDGLFVAISHPAPAS